MRIRQTLAGLGLCGWLAGCACPSQNTLFQASTIDALMAGVYDGDESLAELRRHGDFGIGTFNHLDGELVLLDGEFHQVKADGRVTDPDLHGKTPFAAVCAFRPENTFAFTEGADLAAVEKQIDAEVRNPNQFRAFRIDGHFKVMKTRSVPAQTRPYPPLKKVTAVQPEFTLENVTGTIVGFRCPEFVAGVNVPGYHLHFLSQDASRGGHVLAFEMVTGTAQVDLLNRFLMKLPDTADFAAVDLARDRQQDLQSIEKDMPSR